MRIALIKDGIVINVIEAEQDFIDNIEDEIIVENSVTGNAYINGDIKDGKFRPPMPANALSWDDSTWTWILPVEEVTE